MDHMGVVTGKCGLNQTVVLVLNEFATNSGVIPSQSAEPESSATRVQGRRLKACTRGKKGGM